MNKQIQINVRIDTDMDEKIEKLQQEINIKIMMDGLEPLPRSVILRMIIERGYWQLKKEKGSK